MTTSANNRGRLLPLAVAALGLALAAPPALGAHGEAAPHVSTMAAAHQTATSGELRGSVNPRAAASITYYFEYGPTTAYGIKTKPVAVPIPNPPKSVPVGQAVTGLHVNWDYRIAAVYTTKAGVSKGPIFGKNRTFTGGKAGQLRFVISKEREERISVAYGGDALLTGGLSGTGGGDRSLTVQSTPYPFAAPFATFGTPILTSASGR